MWQLAVALASRHAMDQNHPDLRWHTIRTEHFAIHFPESRKDPSHPRWMTGRGTATRLAAVADDVWMRLATEIGTFPNERVHVVVIESEDDLVGFTLTQQDWIVFSGNPGPELARMRGRTGWVADLLAHELAHVFTLKQAGWLAEAGSTYGIELGGLAEDGVNQLGVQLTLTEGDPYWWSEGAAEFWSERIGVNTWTSAREATLRSSALDGRLLDEVSWAHGALLTEWYDPERAYQQGYAFHRWFAEEFGDEAWREVTRAAGARLRLDWERVFVEVVGRDLPSLKAEFEADVQARVAAEVATLRARGLAEGQELALWSQGWQPEDARTADRWALKSAEERQDERLATGTNNLHATYSADGRWFARHRGGWTEIRALDEGMWTVFAGEVPDWDMTRMQRDRDRRLSVWLPARYSSDLDFIPGGDALVTVGWEGSEQRIVRPGRTAWTQLYRVDLHQHTVRVPHRGGHVELPTLEELDGRDVRRLEPIPGTLRAMDPSVSPDGSWLAYTVYGDGTTNLVVSRVDGSERRELTSFDDGTWIQGTDWSPDGGSIVFTMHRGHQQDLWTADRASGALTALTEDRWEELDPHWATDGAIWFSADVDGVYDIFRRDPSGRIDRMTRVSTSAQAPSVTPDGNLLYTRFTGFGAKSYGVPRTELLWEDATDRFGRPEGELERIPATAPPSRPYRPLRSLTGLAMGPMLRLDRDLAGRVIPRLGVWFKLRDAVEVHTVSGQAWIGGDAYAQGAWTWHRFWPDLTLSASHWVGQLPDTSGRRMVSTASAVIELPWTSEVVFDLGLMGFRVAAEQDGGFADIHRSRVMTAGVRTGDRARLAAADERTGSAQRALLTRGDSVLAGGKYAYHRFEWLTHTVVDAPTGYRSTHRIVVDTATGITDRPVAIDDALRAGGDHPYALRPGVVQGSIELPGYPPFAFAGRSLVVLGIGWRSPLARDLRQRIGPWVVDDVWVQVGGHGGLVVGRTPARSLADVAGQLRVRSLLFDARWDSVLTVAWGAPAGPVPGGPRFVLGLGTGF